MIFKFKGGVCYQILVDSLIPTIEGVYKPSKEKSSVPIWYNDGHIIIS